MVFPVIMYGCYSWTIKKAEHQRIDAFELWCRRRLLRVPWPARRSNQSILKEISSEYSLEGLMLKLKLKLQYFGYLMWRTNWRLPERKVVSGRKKQVKEIQFSSVQFSHSVISNSLQPHGPQHTRSPCPSPTPRDYPNSRPLSR